MNLQACRTAIVEALEGSGFNAYPYISGAQDIPFVAVGNVDEVEYLKDFAGSCMVSVKVWVFVDRVNDVASAQILEDALSTSSTSVYSKLRNIDTDAWRSLKILKAGPIGTSTFGTIPCLVLPIEIEIYSKKEQG